MKRCHRFISRDTSFAQEPYHRFDFEKSLRKYEKLPSKKQKRDAVQARHVQQANEVEKNVAVEGKVEQKAVQVISKCEQLPVSPETTEEVRQCQQSLDSLPVKQFYAQPEPNQQDTTNNEVTPDLAAQQPQQKQLSQQLPTATAFQLCQQKEQCQLRSSGRFHLSSSVFISTRSLQRLVRLGSEQLVLQELFKQRQYLAQDSREVARRVREYMEQ